MKVSRLGVSRRGLHTFVAFVFLLSCLCGAALAQGQGKLLGPKKASDLVVIVSDNTQPSLLCNIPLGTGRPVNLTQNQDDGTTSTLAIPANQALVITSLQARAFGSQANAHYALVSSLEKDGGTPVVDWLSGPTGGGAMSDSNAFTGFSLTFPTGFVITPGWHLCAYCQTTSDTPQCLVTAQGYFAPDE